MIVITRLRVSGVLIVTAAAAAAAACAPSNANPQTTAPPTTTPSATSTASSSAASTESPAVPDATRPDATAIFARIKPDLVKCYEQGKKTTPAMIEGKLTLNAAIDPAGKPTCVIPTEDTGLTQEVEDCMSAQFANQTFDASPAPWSAVVPVVIRSSVVQIGDVTSTNKIHFDTVETHRMANAFEVLESIEPTLSACVRGADKSLGAVRSVLVGARVGTDGRNQCAMASSPSGALPAKIGDCLTGVLRATIFPPPKGGPGLILIPMNLGQGR